MRLDVRDAGPERRELRPPAARARPGDVGDHHAVEDVCELRRYGAGRSGHSVLSTISRSTTSTRLLERVDAERGHAAPAEEDRQIGQEERLHDARGRRGAPAVQPGCESSRRRSARPSPTGKTSTSTSASSPSSRVGLGDEDDRPRRVPLGEPGEDVLRRLHPLRREPTRYASSRSFAGRACPSPARCAARRPRARSRGPTPSAAAMPARLVPSARPPPAAPRFRPHSSGTRAGRAPRPRRSRRRAPTAPRPRRCA